MIPLTPGFLIAAATSFDGLRDCEGSNFSRIVARLVTPLLNERAHMSAAFVFHTGFWSHFDPTANSSSWPLPPVANCKRLGEFATRYRILEEEPMEGDIFLLFDVA